VLRRIQRDTVERGRSIAEIITQYHATVRPMNDEFVEPSKQNADLIVHGHDEDELISRQKMELAMRVICNHLRIEAGLMQT
jgi:uridine kinase